MLRIVLGSIGVLIFVLFATCNCKYIFDYVFKKKKGTLIPLVGGGVGAIGVGILPYSQIQAYWWLPFVLDPGCCYLLVMQTWGMLFKRKSDTSDSKKQ